MSLGTEKGLVDETQAKKIKQQKLSGAASKIKVGISFGPPLNRVFMMFTVYALRKCPEVVLGLMPWAAPEVFSSLGHCMGCCFGRCIWWGLQGCLGRCLGKTYAFIFLILK